MHPAVRKSLLAVRRRRLKVPGIAGLTPGKRLRKKPEQRERNLQDRAFDFLDYALIPPAWSYAIPGGHKVATTLPGYRKGFPDGAILFEQQTFYLEFKDGEDGVVSDAQEACHERLAAAGVPVAVIRRLEDIEIACFRWQIPLRARITAGGAWVRDEA